jgi:L-lactate dehydrogenase (cytochrome)
MRLDSALTIGAKTRVPRMFFDPSESGSWTESTFQTNESDFSDILFRQRVAVDLDVRDVGPHNLYRNGLVH